MIDIALVVGHKERAQGARNDAAGVSEFNFNNALAYHISSAIEARGLSCAVIHRDRYRDLPDKINSVQPGIVVSMHCNAFDMRAHGCEVLYHETNRQGARIAGIMQSHLQGALENRHRGIKARGEEDRGGYLLANTWAPCVICEPFFLDNDAELANAEARRDLLIEAYAKGAINALRTIR